MKHPIDKEYYINRKDDLLAEFEKDIKRWNSFLLRQYGEIQSYKMILAAREEFDKLIPQIPYIGGDANKYTENFLDSVRYLALYKTMKNFDFSVEEIGRVIYEGYLKKITGPQSFVSPAERLTPQQKTERNLKNAAESQEKRYPDDYVYTYIGGGKKFDYGYDFTECASQKLYHAHAADELLPYYCYLDFVAADVRGTGFTRTMALYEGDSKCNHRFKVDGKTKAGWPPPFLKRKKR